jgi:hypothetical protein
MADNKGIIGDVKADVVAVGDGAQAKKNVSGIGANDVKQLLSEICESLADTSRKNAITMRWVKRYLHF